MFMLLQQQQKKQFIKSIPWAICNLYWFYFHKVVTFLWWIISRWVKYFNISICKYLSKLLALGKTTKQLFMFYSNEIHRKCHLLSYSTVTTLSAIVRVQLERALYTAWYKHTLKWAYITMQSTHTHSSIYNVY